MPSSSPSRNQRLTRGMWTHTHTAKQKRGTASQVKMDVRELAVLLAASDRAFSTRNGSISTILGAWRSSLSLNQRAETLSIREACGLFAEFSSWHGWCCVGYWCIVPHCGSTLLLSTCSWPNESNESLTISGEDIIQIIYINSFRKL